MPNNLTTYIKLHKYSILLTALGMACYYTFAHHLQRTEFIKLLVLFAGLFFISFKLIQFEKWNFKFLLVVGILFRAVFLFVEPNLSQDFYRFIWDGELVRNFINPYLHIPNSLIEQQDLVIANAQELYNGMGSLSAKHYSNYPPLNQFLFAVAAVFGGKTIMGSVVVMRLIIIIADVGIVYFGRKLLRKLNKSTHLIFWYFLNPLVIIELTGNLHFEGVMLFFFVCAIYLLSIDRWKWAGIIYALSISIKLVPLLFLPLFLKHFNLKRSMLFYLIVGGSSLLLIAPFYSSVFIANYSKTVGLWFSNFEFNAGLYNGIKHIAIQFEAKPWELIKAYGKITPIVTILFILLVSILRKNQNLGVLLSSMLYIVTFYYFLATTVHPWYIIFLLVLAIFTEYRFALLWSAVVVLSYFAYSNSDFKEHLGLLSIEYIVVFGFLAYEIIRRNAQKPLFCKK